MTSFDGLQFDVLNPLHGVITPQDIPEDAGVPINPMLLPADWSSIITIRTRWQSDVTRPRVGSRESLSLASRPVRSISVNLKGPSHGESYALLQAMQQHAFVESPVPLYPDAVDIDSWEHAGGTLTVEAAFSYRRFFVGCRVVVFSIQHRADRNTQRSMFGVVAQLNAESAVITLESDFRDILPSDVIAPCIDVELSEGASGTLLTDGVAEIDITWNEVEGGSTLPSLWPQATHGDTTLLAPIAETASFDGERIALFPGDVDWSNGIGFDLVTPSDSSNLGRSRLLEVTQKPHIRFTAEVLCGERSEAWQVLRFFDAMQGRTGTFAFPHPVHAFELLASTSNTVDISMVGSPQAARNQLHYVALIDSAGETHIRRVVTINDLSTSFRVTWNIAYPVSNIVEVRHAWVCAFASDEIDEDWYTNGVTRVAFEIDELPLVAPLTVDEAVFSYAPEVTDPLRSIPDCSLLLKAGLGCIDVDSYSCTVWPGIHHRVAAVRDTSRLPEPGEEHFTQIGALNISAFGNSAIVRLFDDAGFGTQPIFMQSPFQLQVYGVQNPYDTLWGPDGWTMFFVVSPRVRNSAYQILWNMVGSGLAFQIILDTPNPSVFFPGVFAGIVVDTGGATLNIPALATVEHTGQARILAVRMNFATNNIQAWLDGAPFIAPTTYAPAFPTAWDVSSLQWLGGSDGNSAKSAAALRTLMTTRMLGAMTVQYRRPLSQAEMREVYQALADIYFAPTHTKIVVS